MLKLRDLLKTETAADISAALASFDVPALRAVVDTARAARTELLLTGSDAQILAAEREIESARLEADRAEAAALELERRLATATETERVAALTARQAETIRERDEVVRHLVRDYAKHANALTTLLERIVASNERINRFNSSLADSNGEVSLYIHGFVEAAFMGEMYSSPFGNLANFAHIPAAPGAGGFWSGKSH